jgi:hypothetical protein
MAVLPTGSFLRVHHPNDRSDRDTIAAIALRMRHQTFILMQRNRNVRDSLIG